MKVRIIVLGLILLAFSLRLYHLDYQSLWTDEGFSVAFASLSPEQMLRMWHQWDPDAVSIVVSGVPETELAAATDTHAPSYYFLLHYWMLIFGRTEFAIRFLSVLPGLLIVPLLYAMGRRLLNPRVGLYAAVLAMVSPFYVAYSQEARMYSWSLVLSLISTYLVLRIISCAVPHRHAIAYAVATALALYTHYLVLLVLVFQNLLVLSYLIIAVRRPTRKLQPTPKHGLPAVVAQPRGGPPARRMVLIWLLAQVGVLVLLLPWAPTILRQSQFPRNEALAVPEASQVLDWYWQALNLAISPVYRGTNGLLILVAIVAGAIIVARWVLDRQSRRAILLLVSYLGIPLALTVVILQFQPMYHPRYVIAASGACYLLLAIGLDGLRRFNRYLPHIACVSLLALYAGGISSYYSDSTLAKDDARGVATFLAVNASADDLVVLDNPVAIDYYYRGQAPFVYIPGKRSVAPVTLEELADGRRNVYHVKWWQANTDPSALISFLLSKEGILEETSQFRGFTVDRYRMRQRPGGLLTAASARETRIRLERLFTLKAAEYGVAYTGNESNWPAEVLPQGGKLWAVMKWQIEQGTDLEHKAFVHLKDSQGHLVGQSDRGLRKGQLPTQQWKAGDAYETYHIIELLPGTPPGSYRLEAGLYEAATQRRLSVVDDDLTPLGGSVTLGQIKVVRSSERLVGGTTQELSRQLGISTRTNLRFGAVRLLGYHIASRAVRPGDSLPLTLLWQANMDVKEDLALRLEAIAGDRQVFSSAPLRPNANSYPSTGWVKGELVRDWQQVLIPPDLAPGRYAFRGVLMDLAAARDLGIVELGTVEVKERIRNTTVPSGINRLAVRYGDHIELVGYELRPTSPTRPGHVIELTLFWHALHEMDKSLTVFAHLLDGGNKIRAQHDGLPVRGEMPTTSWLSDEVVADKHLLVVDKDASPGEFVLEVGVYNAADGQRLRATSQTVKLMGDAALIARVAVGR